MDWFLFLQTDQSNCADFGAESQWKSKTSIPEVFFSVPFLHQGELEKLNQSTDDINRRETELEVQRAGS